MRYIPNTEADRAGMLQTIGVDCAGDLFAGIPAEVRLNRPLDLPPAMSELELLDHVRGLAARNSGTDRLTCFIGAGAYDHFIPAVVHHLTKRAEFYTAYTPYQPEISQGTLQAIYEFQSLICELTGMDLSNASMYDGASALAEAAIMCIGTQGRREILVSRSVHPEWRRVVQTYLAGQNISLVEIPVDQGVTGTGALESLISDRTAGVLIQNPNFFGRLEPVERLEPVIHGHGALMAVAADPISLGILKAPGDYGADIVCGEAQVLGNSLSFGGPYLGYLAAREKLARRMPGRISGATVDSRGNRGFVLTLQAREQHIRREKATSNICSNQALNALTATIYLTVMGKAGLREVAGQCFQKAVYAQKCLTSLPGWEAAFPGPFFREFAVRSPGDPELIIKDLAGRGILAGYPLGRDYPELNDCLLIAVTEKRTRREIDSLVIGLGVTK